MPRVRKGASRTQKRQRMFKMTKGYQGSRRNQRGPAKAAIITSLWYAYRDRRQRKRDMRALFITRVNAACRMRGVRYSQFVSGLKMSGIKLNRKMLAEIAISDPVTFDKIVELAKKASRAGVKKAA